MPGLSAFRQVTAPFSRIEAWGYDRFVGGRAVEPLMALLMQSIASVAAERPSVLDIGCGGGHLLVALAEQHPGWTSVGLDLNHDQVRRAAARASRLRHGFSVVEGSAGGLPFPADGFDVVLSVTSIKHWPDQRQGMREALRVLRPGGRYFIAEVNRDAGERDAHAFLDRLGVPAILHRPAYAMFKRFVLSRGWGAGDADGLAKALDLTDFGVECPPSPPVVVLAGTKTPVP